MFYSSAEISFLQDHYRSHSFKEMASRLGRSEASVRIKCSKLGLQKRTFIDIAFVRERFKDRGFELLSTEYLGPHAAILFKCSEGHINSVLWASFYYQNQGCSICSGAKKKDMSFVLAVAAARGFEVLSADYVSNDTSLLVRCSGGHVTAKTLHNLQKGRRCQVCAGTQKKRLSDVRREVFCRAGYIVVAKEYKSASTRLRMLCDKGHYTEISWANFNKGHRCARCNIESHVSKAEHTIATFCRSVLGQGVDVRCNDRVVIGPRELDIYIPHKRLAIEYCGLYWHNDACPRKDRYYHARKVLGCASRGVHLVTVFEDEFRNNEAGVLECIRALLTGSNPLLGVSFLNAATAVVDLRLFNPLSPVLYARGFRVAEYIEPLCYLVQNHSRSRVLFSSKAAVPTPGATKSIFDCGYLLFHRDFD